MGKFDDPHENPFGEGIEISISKKCTEPIDCIYHTARFSQSGRETTPQNDFEIHVMHDIRFFLFVQAD
jgi:hypothetical protein